MIITIARQCGSGGHEIGKELASRLGLELYDRKKLEEEAKKLGKLDENKEFFQEKGYMPRPDKDAPKKDTIQ